MTKRKEKSGDNMMNHSDELVDKVDEFTQKVERKVGLLLLVPTLISRLFNGIGSIFSSLGDAFDINKERKRKE